MRRTLLLGILAVCLACGEGPAEPSLDISLAVNAGKSPTNSCAASPTFIATDEATLGAALAAAVSGDVIGLDGMIELRNSRLRVDTDGVTVTCATPGSGVFFHPDNRPDNGFNNVIVIAARDVTISHLVVDATETRRAVRAFSNNAGTVFADRARFSDNTVTCGPGSCLTYTGVPDAVITDNHFASAGSLGGLHIQGAGPRVGGVSPRPIDGTRVERNVVETAAFDPTATPWLGGIRVRDGQNVIVDHNTVLGPWGNSLSIDDLSDSRIKSNSLEGAEVYGVALGINRVTDLGASENEVSNNLVSDAGTSGAFATKGTCSNVFRGNNLNHNPIGLHFDVATGANTYIGNKNVVVDDGDFDCDGDGVSDPNVI